MAYDKEAFNAWHKQFPDATDEEVQHVKDMYGTPDEKAPPAKTPAETK